MLAGVMQNVGLAPGLEQGTVVCCTTGKSIELLVLSTGTQLYALHVLCPKAVYWAKLVK